MDRQIRDSASFEDAAITLSHPAEAIASGDAVQALRRHYHLVADVSPLRGERDTNFLVSVNGQDAYVLRVANSAEQQVVADFRAAELMHLEQSAPELPVPRIRLTANGAHGFEWMGSNGRRIGQLVTYLPGIPMATTGDSALPYRQLGEVAARMALALEGFDHPGARLPLLWDINQASQALRYVRHTVQPEQARMVRWALTGLEDVRPVLRDLRSQVIHNDLNPHNVMISADSSEVVGIIDFGDSVYSTLVNDVAVACSYLIRDLQDPLAPIREFLTSYCRTLPLSEAELAVLPQLIAARHALTVIITNWRAAMDADNSSYILRNQNTAIHGLRCLSTLAPEQARDQMLEAGSRGAM